MLCGLERTRCSDKNALHLSVHCLSCHPRWPGSARHTASTTGKGIFNLNKIQFQLKHLNIDKGWCQKLTTLNKGKARTACCLTGWGSVSLSLTSVVCPAYTLILCVYTALLPFYPLHVFPNRKDCTAILQLRTVFTVSPHYRVCSWTSVSTTFQMHLCGCLLCYDLFNFLFAGTIEIFVANHTLGTVLLQIFIFSITYSQVWSCLSVKCELKLGRMCLFCYATIYNHHKYVDERDCCLIGNS